MTLSSDQLVEALRAAGEPTRVRILALQAQKQGKMTEELRDALADNVPVVFGTILAVTMPLVAFFAVVKPFS